MDIVIRVCSNNAYSDREKGMLADRIAQTVNLFGRIKGMHSMCQQQITLTVQDMGVFLSNIYQHTNN